MGGGWYGGVWGFQLWLGYLQVVDLAFNNELDFILLYDGVCAIRRLKCDFHIIYMFVRKDDGCILEWIHVNVFFNK